MRAAATGVAADRPRVVDIVRRHGWNATSFQTLGGRFTHFFHGDGCVAYVDTGSAWVAAGAPIAATAKLAETAAAFVDAARASGRRACFFGTEDRFTSATGDTMRAISIGEQPSWDPRVWSATLVAHAGLREQLRRARAKGVKVRRVTSDERHDGPIGRAVDALIERWLATRAMPPMDFLVDVRPFERDDERRCFIAEREGSVVGLAYVVPVPGREGWFIENLVRAPNAPNGTVESLVDAVMRWAAESDGAWLTLGLAPLAGDVPLALRIARRRLGFLYDFEGLQRFKARLRPAAWQPIHLSYPSTQNTILTTLDALAAFARGGIVRFGARTVARGPAIVLAALASLLVVWIALLASASVTPWFGGHAIVKWGWVAFDVGVVVALAQLVRRPTPRLVTVLACLVTADALTTPIEAWFWNLPHLDGWVDATIVLVACAAPALAAWVLWGARSRILKMHAPAISAT